MKCLSEDALMDFLAGQASPGDIAAIDEHLAGCTACRELVALAAGTAFSLEAATELGGPTVVVASPASALLTRGTTVGRYIVIGLVGRGGMGDVYSAFDPELNRKVALKLIKGEAERADDQARKRLLREAKAAARLSHANVVVVYDAGTIGDRVFIAMEFIEGQTLHEWVKAAPRSWQELVDAFLAAGRGLAAAHAAGLVHRDFKPHNVMVATDGTVRVMDFGLASERSEQNDVDRDGAEADRSRAALAAFPELHGTVAAAMTRTGMLVGTPAYMAPEQFRAERADERSDQFSFCVTLYEALYGQRPFAGDDVGALADSVLTGRVREAPAGSRVPKRVRRILLRGLARERAQRFPSMSDLLAELGRTPERRRRTLVVGAVVALVLLVVGAGMQRTLERPGAQCRRTSERLAGIWDITNGGTGAQRRDVLSAAFVATGAANAGETWQRVSATLDRYAQGWTRMSTESCEATRVSGEQSPEVLELRTTCLGTSLESLRALTDVFAKADRGVVDEAVNAANALPDLARCADVKALKAVTPPPRDRETRAKVEKLRKRLVEIRVLRDAGKAAVALPLGRAVVDDARAIAYKPALAEALELDCWLEEYSGMQARCRTACEQAIWAAEASRYDEIAASAVTILVGSSSGVAPDVHQRWVELARAIVERMGPGHDRIEGWLEHGIGRADLEMGDAQAAVGHFERAIALKTAAEGADHPDVSLSLNSYGNALQELGDPRRGLEMLNRATTIMEKAYGASYPFLGGVISNEGEILNALSRPKEALALFRKSLAIMDASLDPKNAWLAFPLTGFGRSLLALGRPREAVAPLERALAIRDSAETVPLPRGETRFALAQALWESGGDRARALTLAASARSEYQRVAKATNNVAEIDTWLRARKPAR